LGRGLRCLEVRNLALGVYTSKTYKWPELVHETVRELFDGSGVDVCCDRGFGRERRYVEISFRRLRRRCRAGEARLQC
jgi:hypothetical protein